MSKNLITVATYNQSIDAELARGKLEEAGIEAFIGQDMVPDEDSDSFNTDEFRLQVRPQDVEEAYQLLHESYPGAGDASLEKLSMTCPKCGSENVYREGSPYRFVPLWLFFLFIPGLGLSHTLIFSIILPIIIVLIPFVLFRKDFVCQLCHYRWR